MASFVTVAVLFALLACPSNVFGQANPEGYIVTAEFWWLVPLYFLALVCLMPPVPECHELQLLVVS